MIEKPLDQVTEEDLQALVAQRRAEGRRLDYKLELSLAGSEASKEFLADVISFSNTDGGDLIIGIRDEDGTAAEVVGIPPGDMDENITRIENLVRDSVEPRLPGFHIHTVPLADGRTVLVLRMPASLVAPHRVRTSNKFHARNSRGKYPMDVGELRTAFAATERMPQMMRELHTQAAAATTGANMPTRLTGGPIVIVTIAPLNILREARDLEIDRDHALQPISPNQINARPNYVVSLDGLIVYAEPPNVGEAVRGWAVNHRRGYVDFAWRIDTTFFNPPHIVPDHFTLGLVGAARSTVTRLRLMGLEGPWIAMASLKGVRGFMAARDAHFHTQEAWLDEPYLGEVIGEQLHEQALLPLIKAFWRVFGEASPPDLA